VEGGGGVRTDASCGVGAQNNIKPLAPLLGKRDPQVFTCHAWMPDEKERCVVGTDVGDLLLVDAGEVRPTTTDAKVASRVPLTVGFSDEKVANRDGRDFGWEVAHGAVTRRPPISLDTMVARTGGYTRDVGVWDFSIVQGPFSVAPCQTLAVRFATAQPTGRGARPRDNAQTLKRIVVLINWWCFFFFQLRCSLASPGEGVAVHSIVPYSKGFLVGCDHGLLALYEKTEDKEYYKLVKSFSIEGHANKITSLAVQPSEETLLLALDTSQLFSLVLSNVEIMKPEEMNFELFAQDFHSQAITGLDCCIRKPLVATCSMDMSVRIWNYHDKHLEQMKYFPEEAYSIAFHPSGLHILVGFADKLRLMNLLMDDIRTYKEFGIKGCREVVFSHGGAFFAAVNSNTIQVNTHLRERQPPLLRIGLGRSFPEEGGKDAVILFRANRSNRDSGEMSSHGRFAPPAQFL
jgi:hypothetical protein